MSAYYPQPEGRQEVEGQNRAEEAASEKPMGKEMLEHQPHSQLQQPQPEPHDQERSSKRHQSAVPRQTLGVTEMRLVLLGRMGSGKSAAANAVLGREEFETGEDDADDVTQECEKSRGTVAGRQVAVVNTPDWLRSQRTPEEVRHQLSACAALVAPGPHAFLLCVALDQPAEVELRALRPLEEAFGPNAVRGHTLVLFTHSDRLAESEEGVQGVQAVENYIVTRRADLVELVERCGDRFHVLEVGGGAKDEAVGGVESVEGAEQGISELLEKVEQMVKEAGNSHYTSSLFQRAEAMVKQRQLEIIAERREERGEEVDEVWEEEEWDDTRDEAERSADDIQLIIVPSLWLSPSFVPPPSFLRSVWETLAAWLRSFLKFIRGGALLGGVVRVFVGGPLGGILGATVGSVVTEVGKRKHVKKQ